MKDKKQTINCEGIVIQIDEHGFLVNPDDWNEFVASALARKVFKKEITPDMLGILYFIREYYKTENFFPSLTFIAKIHNKSISSIMKIFGNNTTAWKIAGLPQPDKYLYF